jgi:predicted peptidase
MNILDQNLSEFERKNLYENSESVMLWHCQCDPRFSYYVYIPESIYEKERPIYKIICIVHGTARSIENYRQAYKEFANKNQFIIIMPLFPGGLFDNNDFNSYKLLICNGVRYDLILLSMIDELSKKYRIYKDKFFMSGFSGGGQFVQRFFYVHPKRLMGLCIGAPGRITYINDKVDYFWGTRDFNKIFDKEIEIEAMKNVPVQLLIGENDVSFIGESPYGSNRMERIINLKKNLEECDIKVQLDIIEGIAHSGNDNIKAKYQIEFFQKILGKESSKQTELKAEG